MCATCDNDSCGGCGPYKVPEGPAGDNGWSPQFAVVADGSTRQVLQLIGWTGGSGTNPGHIGEYVGPSGFTAVIGDASNIRGTDGSSGSNRIKYVKIFETSEIEQELTIQYAEWTGCGLPDPPCIDDDKDINVFVDLHIQLWWRLNSGVATWSLLKCAGQNGSDTGDDYTMGINHSTGLITINTLNNQGLYRAVIIA